MITEDYVSFETAKLLKEKGFDEYGMYFYTLEDEGEEGYKSNKRLQELAHNSHPELEKRAVSCPTIQMAMKWLRLEHELHIEPIPDCFDYKHGDIHDGWYCEITHLSDMSYDADYDSHKKHKTYEGACEDAIKFCLENLI